LIAALHHAGLASLTHMPSPMAFLNSILGRPDNERPFVLMVVGYPAAKAMVPAISRKPLDEVAAFFDFISKETMHLLFIMMVVQPKCTSAQLVHGLNASSTLNHAGAGSLLGNTSWSN
jgi:hypothetical protein